MVQSNISLVQIIKEEYKTKIRMTALLNSSNYHDGAMRTCPLVLRALTKWLMNDHWLTLNDSLGDCQTPHKEH